MWAQIVSPDAANEPDEPITDFIEVDLIREGDSQTWSAVYGDWQTPGLYQVTFMASGNDGHEPPELLLAEPWPIQISLEPAYGAPDVYDLYFNDATAATLNQMLVNNPQAHVISDAADEDWATAIIPDAGWPYSVHVENAASGLDAELSVYLNGPANAPETPEDETGFGGSETFSRLNWPKAGKIWIRVRAAALAEGEPTSYTLVVRRNTGANIVIPIISGTQQWSLIGPQGGELVLRGTGSGRAETGGMDLYDGAAAWPYTKHKVQIPAGATGTQTLPFMLEYPKQYKNDWALYVALQAWNAEPQRANNASVIILCAPDGYCIPSDASFKITCEYQDGSHFGSEVIDDLPDGAEEARMSLYRFLFNADGISGRWEIVPGKHIDFAENTVTAVVRELSCSGNLCFDEIDGQIVEYSYGFFAVAPASARDAEVDSPAWRQYE
ncbi:MAG: hypothetical protein BWZ10_02480 [candidate division BRC1 bacterium ADurb.BinA364]|nr:MAG: hypothetical protein BWZ10_02480 [candidate division BRC1 bacterium ADurb.BinA364]